MRRRCGPEARRHAGRHPYWLAGLRPCLFGVDASCASRRVRAQWPCHERPTPTPVALLDGHRRPGPLPTRGLAGWGPLPGARRPGHGQNHLGAPVLARGCLDSMRSPADVTYLADTVVVLRYFEAGGSVRQAISVAKKRSGGHEGSVATFRGRSAKLAACRSSARLPTCSNGASLNPR
jgi:hypothetical protein